MEIEGGVFLVPFFCFFLRSVKAKSSLTNSLSLSLTSFSLSHPKQAEPWSQSGESRASKVRKRENKRVINGERENKIGSEKDKLG